MKSFRTGPVLILGALLMGCGPRSSTELQHAEVAALPQVDSHQTPSNNGPPPLHAENARLHHDLRHHDAIHPMLRLDHGRPWATDAPLVEGMERIRTALAQASALPELDFESAAALAGTVRDQIKFLVANCRLEPDADATLHVIIAQLLNAAAALEADPASPEGLPQMRRTLHEYPRYFAHPGWPDEASH